MNYEKKYKEALELARVAAFNGHQSLMEGIFPELKESEDERIRKEIQSAIKQLDKDSTICGKKYDYNQWLAWLEKQGEKPQRMISAEAKEAMYDKPAWSEDDEKTFVNLISYGSSKYTGEQVIEWLNFLKQRMGGK